LTQQVETPGAALLRMVDENHWEWRTVVKIMNRSYHTQYTISDLKDMYHLAKRGLLNVTQG